MMMEIDLTLPEKPSDEESKRLEDQMDRMAKIPVYIHVPLPEDSKSELLQSLNAEEDGNEFEYAPHHEQVGQPLRASYEQHLELVRAGDTRYDPRYFVAVVHPDWKFPGVVVVNVFHQARLDEMESGSSDEEKSSNEDEHTGRQSDIMFNPPDQVGVTIANCQISNMEWDDFFEMFEDHQMKSRQSGGESLRDKLSHAIAVYLAEGVELATVFKTLGHWDYPSGSPEFFPFQHAGTFKRPSLMQQAEARHNQLAKEDPMVHPTLYILVDEPDLATHGVRLCTTDPNESLEYKSRRIPAAFQMTAARFAAAADGRDPIHYRTPLFIGQTTVENPLHPYLTKVLSKPHHVISAPFVRPNPSYSTASAITIEQAIKLFPLLCREERFQPNVSKNFFVYCSGVPETLRGECRIVKVDWDGNRDVWEKSVEELWELDLKKDAEVMRCTYAELDEILLALQADRTHKRRVWEGEKITEEVGK